MEGVQRRVSEGSQREAGKKRITRRTSRGERTEMQKIHLTKDLTREITCERKV